MSDREAQTRNLLPPRTARFRRLRIEVVGGPDRGLASVSAVDSPEISVGTGHGNDLILTDPSVSRHHLVIRATSAGFGRSSTSRRRAS